MQCPITLSRFKYPVLIPDCGHTFDLISLKLHLSKERRCPICRTEVKSEKLVIDYMIANYLNLNVDYDQRILKLDLAEKKSKWEIISNNFPFNTRFEGLIIAILLYILIISIETVILFITYIISVDYLDHIVFSDPDFQILKNLAIALGAIS